jgi:transglutaminase-like putative cysteine protease
MSVGDLRSRLPAGVSRSGGAATGTASGLGPFRLGAFVGIGLLILAYGNVLYYVTDIVGGSGLLLAVVAGSLLLATALGRFLRLRSAVAFTLVLFAGGFAVYLLSIPTSQLSVLTADRLFGDTLALLSGLSVLRLTEAGVWALAIAPGPTFLAWYLVVRRRYVLSAAAGGTALTFFVLTGDANPVVTLAGTVGAAGAVGLGTLHERGGTQAQFDTLAAVLAAMIVVSATLSLVPGGAAQPLDPNSGAGTIEQNLVSAQDEVQIQGSIELSPQVRFRVQSTEPQYWKTTSFDRYTGGGWVRTEGTSPYPGRLQSPPGASRPVRQTVTAETRLDALPSAWKPVSLSGSAVGNAQVTHQGDLRPGSALLPGETYTVESQVPQYTREQLRRSGTDYPSEIESTYTQLPSSTSERLRVRSAEVAGGYDNPYDKAVAVRDYLQENKTYSLDVQRPSGDVADRFLFEMDAGYCTYYATTMVVMLRSQGVPARFVTGYTPGEQVGEDRYVVRGFASPAWVEVYFADVGWVRFAPTPASDRQDAETARLEQARAEGEEGVDTTETQPTNETVTTPGSPDVNTTPSNGTINATANNDRLIDRLGGTGTNTTAAPPGGEEQNDGPLPALPDTRTLALGLIALVGAVAGARRTGVTARAYRSVWLRFHGKRRDPTTDAVRAFERLEYLLARQYRPRRDGETVRAYLDALSRVGLDDRAIRVGSIYERAQYAGEVSREDADKAIDLVGQLVTERTPIIGRLRS